MEEIKGQKEKKMEKLVIWESLLSLAQLLLPLFVLSLASSLECRALEILGGQAYGAKQYTRFGVQIYTCIVTLSLACVPVKFSTQCEKTHAPILMELFYGLGEFLCYAVPSDGMICLE
ncbi:hypothetical protein S245_067429 [Arachis hypogaea]